MGSRKPMVSHLDLSFKNGLRRRAASREHFSGMWTPACQARPQSDCSTDCQATLHIDRGPFSMELGDQIVRRKWNSHSPLVERRALMWINDHGRERRRCPRTLLRWGERRPADQPQISRDARTGR
jgi:hypothetical protein